MVSNLGKVTLIHSEEPQMVVVATKIDHDSFGSDKTSVKCLQIHKDYRLNVSLATGLVNKDRVYLSIIRKLNQSFLHKYDLNDLDYLDKCQYLDRANRNDASGVLSSVLVAKVYKQTIHNSKLPQNISPVLLCKPISYRTRKTSTHSCNQQFQKPETLKQHAETCKDINAKGENPSREKYACQEDSTVSRRVSEKASDNENINYHEKNISDHEYQDISDNEYHAISDHEYHNISDSDYHEISDSEYHEISDGEYHDDGEYHEISDDEYHGDSEREYAISNSEHRGVSDHDQYRHVSVTPENHVTITSKEDQPHPMSVSVSQNRDDVENTTQGMMRRWSKNRNKTTRPENLACGMFFNDLSADCCVLNEKSDGDSFGKKIKIVKPHSLSSYQTMGLKDDNNKTSQDICIPTDLSSLSVKGVGRLLKSFNMTRYAAKFENEQIDGETLVALDENALKSLDLTYFHARKLMKVIAGWRPKNDDKSATSTD